MKFTMGKSRNPQILFTSWTETSAAELIYGQRCYKLLSATNIEITGSRTGKNILNRDLSKSLQCFLLLLTLSMKRLSVSLSSPQVLVGLLLKEFIAFLLEYLSLHIKVFIVKLRNA